MSSTLPVRSGLAIVCGLGRSGTTLLGALLSRSPAVEVFNETPHLAAFPSLARLVSEYRRWAEETASNPHESWRGVDAELVARGVRQLFAGYCRAFKPLPPGTRSTRWDEVTRVAAPLVCLKRPEAELEAELYDQLFDAEPPRYVYCIRSPRQVYASHLAVAWGAALSAEAFVEKLASSARAIHAVSCRPPAGRALAVNVETISADLRRRRQVVEEVLHFLAVPGCREIDEFVDEWPPINRAAQVYRGRRFVSENECQCRLQRLEQLLAVDLELRRALPPLLAGGCLDSSQTRELRS